MLCYLCAVKNLVFILIIAIFLKPIFPVIEYVVNYEYISKVLCENKAKPMMHCNGKCHLMKELAKAAENENLLLPIKKDILPLLKYCFFRKSKLFLLLLYHFWIKKTIAIPIPIYTPIPIWNPF